MAAFASERELAETSLLDGERTFFVGEGREDDAGVLERDREMACRASLVRLVSTGWRARLVEAWGVDGGIVAARFIAGRRDGVLVNASAFSRRGFGNMLRAVMPQLERGFEAGSDMKTERGSTLAGKDMIMTSG